MSTSTRPVTPSKPSFTGRAVSTRLAESGKTPRAIAASAPRRPRRILAQMAGRLSDEDIALTLNRVGIRTARGLTWNAARVRAYRSYHNLPALDPTDDKPSEMLTLNEAASILGVCAMTVRRLIGRGILPAVQAAPSIPWSIRRSDLDEPPVKQAVQASKDYPSLTARRDTKTLEIPGL